MQPQRGGRGAPGQIYQRGGIQGAQGGRGRGGPRASLSGDAPAFTPGGQPGGIKRPREEGQGGGNPGGKRLRGGGPN